MMLQENAGEHQLEEVIAPVAGVDLPAVISESDDDCDCDCIVDCDCVMDCDGRGCADACRLCGAREDLWGSEILSGAVARGALARLQGEKSL